MPQSAPTRSTCDMAAASATHMIHPLSEAKLPSDDLPTPTRLRVITSPGSCSDANVYNNEHVDDTVSPSQSPSPCATSSHACYNFCAASKANSISSIGVDGLLSPTQSSLATSPCASLTPTRPSSSSPTPSTNRCKSKESPSSLRRTGALLVETDRSRTSSAASARLVPSEKWDSDEEQNPTAAVLRGRAGRRRVAPEPSPIPSPTVRPASARQNFDTSGSTSECDSGACTTSAGISAAAAAAASRAAAATGTAPVPVADRPRDGRRRSSVDSSGILSHGARVHPSADGRRISASEGCFGHSASHVRGRSAAEEAKASASDTARRIELAAIEAARAARTHSHERDRASSPCASSRLPQLDTGAARCASSRSLQDSEPAVGPSAAEIAKRRAEEAAREMARTALDAMPLRGHAWENGSTPGSASSPRQHQQRDRGAPVRTEAEAIKHRATEFAKELADRVERETAHQRRGGGGMGGGSSVSSVPPPPLGSKAVSAAPAHEGALQHVLAPSSAPPDAKRSARGVGQKTILDSAWLLTLLKPEHRSGRSHLSRSSSRSLQGRSSRLSATD